MTYQLRLCLDSEDEAAGTGSTGGFGPGAGSDQIEARPGDWSSGERSKAGIASKPEARRGLSFCLPICREQPMTNLAYHLVAENWYKRQPADKPYLPQAYPLDGFVHLTHGEHEVVEVGNRYYTGDSRPYLLLTIDLDQVTSEVRYDDPDRRYPHVYGPIDREAILAVREVYRGPMGLFLAIVG
ncbi:MAG TPA: DUF952 domain-containing protein [Thermomicrobiales bacterium]|nr:DUF952 domain-containing protein [Thermomicrobiales bacterium]